MRFLITTPAYFYLPGFKKGLLTSEYKQVGTNRERTNLIANDG
jgi:hypothetical protein